ncbi:MULTISPECIES: hypothetical protein [Pseudomonas]|jgi:hypothetical protein|nr:MULTISPECIES: hypothetical protein [Pseudomonas]MDT6921559.1 hypothetical protein [Pseudomonas atacamensis]MEB2858257.1 hypothetical protein [Pseudomonas atacamensis]
MKNPPGTAEKEIPSHPADRKNATRLRRGIGLLEESGFPRAVSPEAEQ